MSKLVMATTLKAAAQHLAHGGTVAMPTETVYGLAARIDSTAGLNAIFHLKQRPSFDPLIVHISSLDQVPSLVKAWPWAAESLARKFWPGPLTIVVEKSEAVSSVISAGLETVGLRMPQHPIAMALIEAAGVPLAAPSANRFGRTSPTLAAHVENEFPEAIKTGEILLLDGGPANFGVESTVCRVTENEVAILRPGGITEEELVAHFSSLNSDGNSQPIKVVRAHGDRSSPGHTEHHYETKKPLIVIWSRESYSKTSPTEPEAYDVEGRTIAKNRIHEIVLPRDARLAARELYGLLRTADQETSSEALLIRRWVDPTVAPGLWAAIDDRLKRAARLQIDSSAPRV